jgi:RNase H-fold protein (predicted Holliday junction resolvase)
LNQAAIAAIDRRRRKFTRIDTIAAFIILVSMLNHGKVCAEK